MGIGMMEGAPPLAAASTYARPVGVLYFVKPVRLVPASPPIPTPTTTLIRTPTHITKSYSCSYSYSFYASTSQSGASTTRLSHVSSGAKRIATCGRVWEEGGAIKDQEVCVRISPPSQR